jgi:cytochrome c-type biogenesis protein CcmH/NrfG
MADSARETKARQIRISNVNRQVIYKAYLQKRKDELRAEERRKLIEETQREEERLIGEARLREEARHRAEYKDQAVVLCSFFLSVVYLFIMCSFFLSGNLSSLDETKA